MAIEVSRLDRDNLLHEYGVDTQRLQPWAVLNAPFESSYAVVRAGTHSTLHSHEDQEIFVALKGEAVIECDGQQAEFRAGDVAYFKPGLLHRVLNDGGEDFEFYSIWWTEEMAERFIADHRAGVTV
ncbi:MAG TPA: cupin domain-containing protein [Kribbella sp.]|nr:cupin domain-containing protein [Kribbella sp.]